MKHILGMMMILIPVCTADQGMLFQENRAVHRHMIAVELMEREISLRHRCHEIAIAGIDRWDEQRKAAQNRALLKLLKTRVIEYDGYSFCGHDIAKAFIAAGNNHQTLITRTEQLHEMLNGGEDMAFPAEKTIPFRPSHSVVQTVTSQVEAEWKTYLDAVKQFREPR